VDTNGGTKKSLRFAKRGKFGWGPQLTDGGKGRGTGKNTAAKLISGRDKTTRIELCRKRTERQDENSKKRENARVG